MSKWSLRIWKWNDQQKQQTSNACPPPPSSHYNIVYYIRSIKYSKKYEKLQSTSVMLRIFRNLLSMSIEFYSFISINDQTCNELSLGSGDGWIVVLKETGSLICTYVRTRCVSYLLRNNIVLNLVGSKFTANYCFQFMYGQIDTPRDLPTTLLSICSD